MKKNLKNSLNDMFNSVPSVNQKAWKIIHHFYHIVLTKMDKEEISRSELANRLNTSRAYISRLFNSSPNLSIKKMVEIADALELDIDINIHSNHNHDITNSTFLNSYISVSNSDYNEEYQEIEVRTLPLANETDFELNKIAL